MINLHELQNHIKVACELTNNGVTGESRTYEIFAGRYHQKNLRWFKFAKWSTKICSILLVGYIIYKIIF